MKTQKYSKQETATLREKVFQLHDELGKLIGGASHTERVSTPRELELVEAISAMNAELEMMTRKMPPPCFPDAEPATIERQKPIGIKGTQQAQFFTAGELDGDTFMQQRAQDLINQMRGIEVSRRFDVIGNVSFANDVLETEILVFTAGGTLSMKANAIVPPWSFLQMIRCRQLVIQDPADCGTILRPTHEPWKEANGGRGADGPNREQWNSDSDGRGREGVNGYNGEAGKNARWQFPATDFYLIADEVVCQTPMPNLILNFHGAPGTSGGDGGNAGHGGTGEQGPHGDEGFFKCDRLPGNGGKGGNGGNGGAGGTGSNGMDGPTIYLAGSPQAIAAMNGFIADNRGGSPGSHGRAGKGGDGAIGGNRGGADMFCNIADGGNSHVGAAGVRGMDGFQPTNPLFPGATGKIWSVVLTANQLSQLHKQPAIA